MKYRLVECPGGSTITTTEIEAASHTLFTVLMLKRGFKVRAFLSQRRHDVIELIGAPVLERWNGPTWDGNAVRYETPAASSILESRPMFTLQFETDNDAFTANGEPDAIARNAEIAAILVRLATKLTAPGSALISGSSAIQDSNGNTVGHFSVGGLPHAEQSNENVP